MWDFVVSWWGEEMKETRINRLRSASKVHSQEHSFYFVFNKVITIYLKIVPSFFTTNSRPSSSAGLSIRFASSLESHRRLTGRSTLKRRTNCVICCRSLMLVGLRGSTESPLFCVCCMIRLQFTTRQSVCVCGDDWRQSPTSTVGDIVRLFPVYYTTIYTATTTKNDLLFYSMCRVCIDAGWFTISILSDWRANTK